jgi:RND family efflux transporter MFP subunit
MATEIETTSPVIARQPAQALPAHPLPEVHSGQGGNGQSGHFHEEIPTDLPRVGTGMVVIVTLVFVLLLGGLFVLGYLPHRARIAAADEVVAQQNDKPIVGVALPTRADSVGELNLPGDARALQETSIYPRASGYLKTLLVDIGDHVKAGQLLAEIDTPEIDAQLNQSRAALEQAKANATRAKADADFAQTTLRRYQDAAKGGGGAVTEQDIDEKQSALNQANSAYVAAQAAILSAQADVQRLTDMQNFKKVTAPFDGVITARNYDIGALLSPTNTAAGAELFRITRSDTLRVFVNVPQAASSSIKLGQKAAFTVANYPGRDFEGTVTRTTGTIDPATRTLRMQIDIPNPDALLKAGMYGKVRLAMHQDKPPLLVSTSALLFEADGPRVAVVDKTGRIKMQPITLGRDYGTQIEITSGLKGDEQIVTNPGERMADGVEVQVSSKKPSTPEETSPKPRTREATAE